MAFKNSGAPCMPNPTVDSSEVWADLVPRGTQKYHTSPIGLGERALRGSTDRASRARLTFKSAERPTSACSESRAAREGGRVFSSTLLDDARNRFGKKLSLRWSCWRDGSAFRRIFDGVHTLPGARSDRRVGTRGALSLQVVAIAGVDVLSGIGDLHVTSDRQVGARRARWRPRRRISLELESPGAVEFRPAIHGAHDCLGRPSRAGCKLPRCKRDNKDAHAIGISLRARRDAGTRAGGFDRDRRDRADSYLDHRDSRTVDRELLFRRCVGVASRSAWRFARLLLGSDRRRRGFRIVDHPSDAGGRCSSLRGSHGSGDGGGRRGLWPARRRQRGFGRQTQRCICAERNGGSGGVCRARRASTKTCAFGSRSEPRVPHLAGMDIIAIAVKKLVLTEDAAVPAAIAEAETLRARTPDHAGLLAELAKLYLRAQRIPEAIATASEAISRALAAGEMPLAIACHEAFHAHRKSLTVKGPE